MSKPSNAIKPHPPANATAVPSTTTRSLKGMVGMRMKFGEDMEGLQLFQDGISFRSPFPIAGGRVLEMLLCRGSVVVDVMVMHCEHLPSAQGGYAVRTRYHSGSPGLVQLVQDEFKRLEMR